MPRYYFDIDDGSDLRDEIGRDLEEDESIIREEAAQAIISLLKAEIEDSKSVALVLSVRDDSGFIRLSIRLVSQIVENWTPFV